jgi:Uma2 family endonuclease
MALIFVSPTHAKGGAKSLEAAVQLHAFAKKAGGKAFDSNTGFAIGPQRRVFSPDSSWVSQPRIDALTATEAAGFWPISPDVIIEVKSDTDSYDDTVTEIALFIERGTPLTLVRPATGYPPSLPPTKLRRTLSAPDVVILKTVPLPPKLPVPPSGVVP